MNQKLRQDDDNDEKMLGPDPFTGIIQDGYKTLLEDRIILINGEIKDDIVEKAMVPLMKFASNKPKTPITIIVNSYGGQADDAMALVDLMMYVKTPITTVVFGKAMSAAFDIFLAGDYRIAHANSLLMSHAGSESIHPIPLPFIKDIAKLNDELFERWAKFYASRTKMTYDEWYKLITSGRDRFFFPEEALEKGLIHEIHQPCGKEMTPIKTKSKKSNKRKSKKSKRK